MAGVIGVKAHLNLLGAVFFFGEGGQPVNAKIAAFQGFYVGLKRPAYDGAQDKDSVAPLLDAHIERFIAKVESCCRKDRETI